MTKEGRVRGHREYSSVNGRDGGFMLLEGEIEELFEHEGIGYM